MIEFLEQIIGEVFKACGYDMNIRIIKSNRLDLCDYQCDEVFKIAKEYHKNPIQLGEEIVKKINELNNFGDYFKKVEFVKPGFINITVSDKLINKFVTDMFNDDHFNLKRPKKNYIFRLWWT